ncbi:MAG: response regulator [Proteobacteria bacterium]|nr:response regulator [Pseudomonadota bacterium]
MNKNKKVLIIDDEPYIRRVIELKLKARGYQVITATNGVEGLNCFKKYKPQVVVTDINMPKMDGKVFCELTNEFKKKRPFLTLIVTCSVPLGGLQWIDKMDETMFFEKPVSPSKLLDCIDQYFGVQT